MFAILFLVLSVPILSQSPEERAEGPRGDEPSAVSVSPKGESVVMELSGNKPVVSVRINGKGPFRLFLDTGAGATVLNQDLADELKLPVEGTVKIGDPADPQAIEARRNRVKTLEIGGVKFSDLIAVSWDRSILYREGAPRGVLGMPLFRKLLLTIDYPNSRIEINEGSLPAADGKRILNYKTGEGGLFKLPLTVAGKPMGATIDSGSQSGISFPEGFKETLPLADPPREVGRGRTVAGESIIYGAKLKGSVTFGEFELSEPEVRFFGRLTNPNLGYEFLRPYAITIDQANKRIRFEKGNVERKADPALAVYAGTYGGRRITFENGELFLQRLSGPQGEGPKIRLVKVASDEFALEGVRDGRVKFGRANNGTVDQMSVLTPQGEWEATKKSQ